MVKGSHFYAAVRAGQKGYGFWFAAFVENKQFVAAAAASLRAPLAEPFTTTVFAGEWWRACDHV